jgi:hypothetical protein
MADRLEIGILAEQLEIAPLTHRTLAPQAVALKIDDGDGGRVGIILPRALIAQGDDLVLARDAQQDAQRAAGRHGMRFAQPAEGAAAILLGLGHKGNGVSGKSGALGHDAILSV